MNKWVRLALALLAGVFAGGITIALIEMAAHAMVEGTGVFVAAAIALGIAAAIGGSASILIGKNRNLVWIIGVVLAGLSLVNVFSFDHPAWFVPVAFSLLAAGCLSAFFLGAKWGPTHEQ